jgi:hypothetical protein
MDDEKTEGVLLKGADGTDYFIPQEQLSDFAIPPKLKPDESMTEDAPQLDLDAYQAEAEAEEYDDTRAFHIIGIIGVEREPDADVDDSSNIIGVEGEPGGGDE